MTRLALPDTDRVLSRQTGWSRAHWEALADHLLDSLAPYFSRPSRSGTDSDELEGFARSFMVAAFLPDRRGSRRGLRGADRALCPGRSQRREPGSPGGVAAAHPALAAG
jgi:hypothetical protein